MQGEKKQAKAGLNAIDALPKQPPSLVDQYKKPNPSQSKNYIITKDSAGLQNHHILLIRSGCEWGGKCVTRRLVANHEKIAIVHALQVADVKGTNVQTNKFRIRCLK